MMNTQFPTSFVFGKEVAVARRLGTAVVALESAVITHGLPRPHNLQLAQALEQAVRDEGATPATVALLDGRMIDMPHQRSAEKILRAVAAPQR